MEKTKISRREFLKNAGIVAGAAAAGTGIPGLAGCASGPGAALERGLQFEPETLGLTPGATTAELNVTWYAKGGAGGTSLLRLFDQGGRLLQTARGSASGASAGKLTHKVSLGGLEADTRYRYSVSKTETTGATSTRSRHPERSASASPAWETPSLPRG
jgi:phosphodiesterase/alkaline phosphatase D-like protein